MIPGEGNHAATGEGICFRICKKSVGDPVNSGKFKAVESMT
jgi:hypothetical protein